MWPVVIFIFCVIHYAHSEINPPCPTIKQTGQCLGLPKTDKCQTDSTCGHHWMCCPKECGKECTLKRKYGICPTFTDKQASYCMKARVGSNCGGNDADCSGTKKCCPDICGSRQCKEPATASSFKQIGFHKHGVCPPIPKGGDPNFCNLVNVRYDCDVDSDCTERNKKCCGTPCGGRACTNPIKGDRTGCPTCFNNQPSPGCPACIQYQQLCNSDKECNRGHLCCFNPSCGTSCKRTYGR
ncbi:unnamed protein product [Mytilus coruscus]|uniref:WAP domain-containing protein n=1 Tax=Mytilus coruscus TaxID=42192 RepID=A0A6J8EKF1_MYTCO|nr:unnamed protein product [Mytilus coruscus]